tara:strand:+ start:52 stop:333 length:282 start_codon:yes stop_codon:yes gene_type:complete
MNLTTLEKKFLTIMGDGAAEEIGSYKEADLLEDNMSWTFLEDFETDPKIARGVIASLVKKDLAGVDDACHDTKILYFLGEDGIKEYCKLKGAA